MLPLLCTAELYERLRTHRAALRSMLECQYGLVDELLTRGLLTDEQSAALSLQNLTTYKQSEQLIEVICDSNSLPQPVNKMAHFAEALRKTNQGHIVKYIDANGGVKICDLVTYICVFRCYMFCTLIIYWSRSTY